MINKIVCWLFGHVWRDIGNRPMTVSLGDDVPGQSVSITGMAREAKICDRCGQCLASIDLNERMPTGETITLTFK